MNILLLIIGLVLIIKSADVLINSSAKIARKYGISSFIIGITVIAFGTSAPELAVGIVSGISRTNELTLGNIIGSSLSNVALIVGICAIVFPLTTKDSVIKREIPMLLFIQIVLSVMLINGTLSRIDGIILLIGFALFILYICRDAKKSMTIQIDSEGDIDTDGDGNGVTEENQKPQSFAKLWIYSILALVGLFIGGKMTVENSTAIAQSLGLSETLIGLTVVALATTMPELITSIVAVSKKEPDIVLGNCIGSNIFNILFVLGTSSVINPIAVNGSLWFDIFAMLGLTIFVYILSLIQKKVVRSAGVLLLMSYVGYIAYKVVLAITIQV